MRKDTKMNAHVTKSGYKYYTPRQTTSKAPQTPKANKWKKGLKWLGQALLAGLKNLPSLLVKVAITPVFLLLFIYNLLKSLLVTAIGWFVFKVVVGFAVICYWAFLTKEGAPPVSVEKWTFDWIMPKGIPIYYWWEITIILVLAIITALSLTFYSDEV
ncbi:hypothetical protein [Streptococcus pluranimalium]|uniref:hypothetical protein n=1 Tax=Streptococcus pluranimalium TaxID=82348 RepID=UPI003F6931B6